MQTVAIEGVTDQELFDEANADEAPANEAVVETVEAPVEQESTEQTQARDEQGRFAAETPEVVPRVQEEQPKGERIPLAEYLSEREKRQTFENELKAERERTAQERQEFQRRIQALEKPAVAEKVEKPDPLLDPDGYEKYLEAKFDARQLDTHRELDLRMTRQSNTELFDKAYAECQRLKQANDPEFFDLQQKVFNTREPGKALLDWYQARETRREVGNDPNAFFDRRLEAFLADPANQAKVLERIRGGAQQQLQPGTGPKPAPAVSLPPSLTRAVSAATIDADDDDVSDDGLWRHANA